MKRFIRPLRPLHMLLLFMPALLFSGYSGSGNLFGNSDLWEPLHRANRSARDAASAAAMEGKAAHIMEVFRKALPFNPPKGFAVMPRIEYLEPIHFLAMSTRLSPFISGSRFACRLGAQISWPE